MMLSSVSAAGATLRRTSLLSWIVLLVLLVLPAVTVGLEFRLRTASGPYWLGENLDPGYAYLLNSLNIADRHRPYFIGHPGTPIHVIGGVVIRSMNSQTDRAETVHQVLSEPEHYMTAINSVLVFLYGLCAVAAGWIVFVASRRLLSALIIQATPLLSITTFGGLTSVRPEPMMIAMAVLVGALVLLTLKFEPRQYSRRYALAFAVLVGIGMACKVNFLPVALVPIIIFQNWKSRLLFVCATVVVFVLAILPILEPTLIKETIQFMFNLATHTGRYGSGPAGFIEPRNYLNSAVTLIRGDALFFLIVLAGIATLFWRSKFPQLRGPKFRALLAVTVAQVFQLLIVAKHPASRYLIPALALVAVNLVVLLDVVRDKLPAYRMPAILVIGVVILTYQVWAFTGFFATVRAAARDQLDVYDTLTTKYANVPVASYYTVSSPYYALDFGSSYAGNLYRRNLQQLYPNHFFFSPWTGVFSDMGGPVTLDQIAQGRSWFILTGCSLGDPDFKVFLPSKPIPEAITLELISGPNQDRPGLLDCGAIYKASIKATR